MREIKFRAWDSLKEQIVTVCELDWYAPSMTMFVHNRLENGAVNGERFTVMQYTSLRDKNGKEIYEGDIMIWDDVKRSDGKPFIIEFSTDLYGEQYGGGTDYFSGFSFPSSAKYGEVIGNIYENPDLIK